MNTKDQQQYNTKFRRILYYTLNIFKQAHFKSFHNMKEKKYINCPTLPTGPFPLSITDQQKTRGNSSHQGSRKKYI